MPSRLSSRPLFVSGLAVLLTVPAPVDAQSGAKIREPLPLETALSLRGHNGRSPVDLSPDGQWVVHTVQAEGTIPRDSLSTLYSPTGFNFSEGDSRMEATLSNTKTGEVLRLGGSKSASWAAVWSPDGRRIAFYSDEGGEAGLWIWDMATRRARRVPGLIVRPSFGFETVQWFPDGQRILVKVLPVGMTIAQANALGATARGASAFPAVAPGSPSVAVRRFDPKQQAKPQTPTAAIRGAPVGDVSRFTSDLAVVDLRTNQVNRLAQRVSLRFFALSPNGMQAAYSVIKGWEANSQQPNFDLIVQDVSGGPPRAIGSNIRQGYGTEWSWSPDGRTIAYIPTGQVTEGEIVLLPAGGGEPRRLKQDGVPSFARGEGEVPPLWDASGRQLFAIGVDGKLWRVDASSGEGTAVGNIPDWSIRAVVTPFRRSTIWSNDNGRTVWVTARDKGGSKSAIYAVDLTTGQARAALQENKAYSGTFNVDASDSSGEIAFVSTDQQQLHEVWIFGTRDNTTRQASRINAKLDQYELGNVRVIDWRTADGQPLRGALLMPPGYRPGQRVPLAVMVYGGQMGSQSVNSFGLSGGIPALNMHILATRGFAVLAPDAPVREGQTMTDIMKTVMPGVDAAIAQGYVDPDRLAVMGQSYGSFNTLSIITQTNRFKAAVITAAVLHPDLFADYLRATGYYERGQGNMGGSIWEQRDRYLNNSPLFLFDRIQTPLLIGQGERDGNLVPSEAIFTALERLGKPVEYRLYQGEGHVITQGPNVIDFWKRRLAFFGEHLDLTYDANGAVVFDGDRARARPKP